MWKPWSFKGRAKEDPEKTAEVAAAEARVIEARDSLLDTEIGRGILERVNAWAGPPMMQRIAARTPIGEIEIVVGEALVGKVVSGGISREDAAVRVCQALLLETLWAMGAEKPCECPNCRAARASSFGVAPVSGPKPKYND